MVIAYILDTYPAWSETFLAREIAALRRRGAVVHIFALHAGEGAHQIPPLLQTSAESKALRPKLPSGSSASGSSASGSSASGSGASRSGARRKHPLAQWVTSILSSRLHRRCANTLEAIARRAAGPFYYRCLGRAWWRAVQNGAFDGALYFDEALHFDEHENADWRQNENRNDVSFGGTASDSNRLHDSKCVQKRSKTRRLRFDHIHAGFASHPADIAWGAARASGLSWSFSGHARDLFVEGGALGRKLGAARFATACTRAGEQRLRRALSLAHQRDARRRSHGMPLGATSQDSTARAKIIYAPHGLEIAHFAFRERVQSENEGIVPAHEYSCGALLAVGRLVEKKGFSTLLEALSLLLQTVEGRETDDARSFRLQLRLTIVGEGPQRAELEQQIARLRLGDQVRLAGALSHGDTMRLMRDAACLIVPSRRARDGDRDGLPNVVLEAAACGLPLIAARMGGIRDFVDETTGLLCEPDNAEALARAMRRWFAEPEATRLRSLAARRRVIDDFDIDRNIEPLLQAFASQTLFAL